MSNGRRNRNYIPSIAKGKSRIAKSEEIGKVFTSLFRCQFGSSIDSGFKVECSKLLANKMHEDLSSLESPFSLEEIRKATFDLGTNKAHFCYGFPIFFFQKFLDVVKNDLTKLCEDLYLGKANLE